MTRSPFGEACDVCADGGDAAGGFVAHDDRRNAAAGGAVVAVDVAAADAAGGDFNEDFVRGCAVGLGRSAISRWLYLERRRDFIFFCACALWL